MRRADTAKICSNVGLVQVDGASESSFAVAATGVSKPWQARKGLRHLFLAAMSAFDATSRRQASRLPLAADQCSGVLSFLKTSKRINMRKQSFGS